MRSSLITRVYIFHWVPNGTRRLGIYRRNHKGMGIFCVLVPVCFFAFSRPMGIFVRFPDITQRLRSASAFNGRPDPEALDTPEVVGDLNPGCLKALNQSNWGLWSRKIEARSKNPPIQATN